MITLCATCLALSTAPADTTEARLNWMIGSFDGAPEEVFGDLVAVASDEDGVVYTADAQGSIVRGYSHEGAYLGELGRQGDGPGEYRGPSAITVSAEGRVYVRDSRRITILEVDEDPFESEAVATWGGPVYPSSRLPSRLDERGRYYYPHCICLNRSGAPPQHFYLVYEGGTIVDTAHVPPLSTIRVTEPAWLRTGASGGRIFPGLERAPFSPTPTWDVLPTGHIASSDGASAQISITDRDGTVVRRFTAGSDRPRRVDPGERRDSARALRSRLDSVPVPLARVIGMPAEVRELELPDVLPHVVALHVDAIGRIWLRRWPGSAQESLFEVYSAQGENVGIVVFPVDLDPSVAPWIGKDVLVGVTADAAYEFDRVVHFTFEL